MKFEELEELRRFLEEINERQVVSLSQYHGAHAQSFWHRLDDKRLGNVSESSTATCVMSIFATGKWKDGPWSDTEQVLAKGLMDADWKSGALPQENVFTTGHVLESVTALQEFSPIVINEQKHLDRILTAEQILLTPLRAKGCVSLKVAEHEYPPSAYLTQLAVRVLKKREKVSGKALLDTDTSLKVEDWANREIEHQLSLILANSKSQDFYQLAYAIILVAALRLSSRATPDQALILLTGLSQLFQGQLPDGSWPLSRPLFHYPGIGNAHCYEYEMLVQLLQEPELEDRLIRHHLARLRIAATRLPDISFNLGGGGLGWSSGHHPQFQGPESWSTASVFHFAHALERLVAEAIRRSIFEYFDQQYSSPTDAKLGKQLFAPKFLDCELASDGKSLSLRETIFDRFVSPIAREASQIKIGRPLSEQTPMSAIFFGPPGTSKTVLSTHIADFLGWPLLLIDPSYFVRRGLDQVQAEADHIFGMLAVAERIVVLLDEFDEMVRDRERADDILSRFLTTAMLPKLVSMNRRRRLIFIVATNYIDHFDLAISRRGRFDMILQVMPPKADEKLRHKSAVKAKLDNLQIQVSGKVKDDIQCLTYDEFESLAPSLENAKASQEALELIEQAAERCTLKTITSRSGEKDSKTWHELSIAQAPKIRIPGL